MRTAISISMLAAAALLGGCASGGGGGGGSRISNETPPPNAQQQASAAYSPCGTVNGHPVTCVPLRPEFPAQTEINPLACGLFEGACPGYVPPAPVVPVYVAVRQDLGYEPRTGGISGTYPIYSEKDPTSTTTFSTISLQAVGQPGIWISTGTAEGRLSNPFTTVGTGDLVVRASKADLGWEYQSFGIWDDHSDMRGILSTSSNGIATAGTAIPVSGVANFTGKLAALYVSPDGIGSIATANVTVQANFSSRSLSLTSSGTALTRDGLTSVAATNLNVSGVLTYSQGMNKFSGTLATADATMRGTSEGRFHGPTAQELGGVFTLRSGVDGESLIGGYGAKR